MRRTSIFARFSRTASRAMGHPVAFIVAACAIIIWALLGPIFHFSDTWQLVINTATTIVTFLMVFLIQNTQNRDSQAMQIKLDELIRAIEGAHLALLDLEQLSDQELGEFGKRYLKLAEKARLEMRQGGLDTGSPDVDVA